LKALNPHWEVEMMRTYTLRLAILTAVFATIFPVPSATGQMLAWRVEYDSQGRILRGVDPAGRITHYSYTPASNGLVQSVTATPPEGAPVTWRFDEDGQLAAMSDGEGEVAYRYDNRGRLAAVERKGAPAILYGYDDSGRLAEIRVGPFYRVAWKFDFLGRIATIDTPASLIRYEYQMGQGEVIRSLPNGVKTIWKRQANGVLEEITHGLFKKPNDRQYSVLAQYTYAHGPDGRITAIRERSEQGGFMRRYSYDTIGRLIHATGPDGREYSYEYDAVGNRTKAAATGSPDQICTYDWAGQLTGVNGQPCRYDASGNLAEISVGGTARRYRYHPDGRLAEVREGNDAVQYRYDGFGRLVSRTSAAGETRFIPDPQSPYWQPLVIDEPGGARTLVIWDGDAPLALVRNNQVEWLLHDHLHSVRLVADAKGGVSRACEYDPFGVPQDAVPSASMSPGFAGLFLDGNAGGFHTLARTYAAALGRFLQPESIHAIGGHSLALDGLYAYARGNPVALVDRDGRAPEWYDNPAMWTSPNFFSALVADANRSVASQVENTLLRARALAGETARARTEAQGSLTKVLSQENYDPNQMTLFVRTFHPENPGATIIPHGGIAFGHDIDLSGLRLDGVELQATSIGGQKWQTVVVPMRISEQELGGVIHLMPLETDKVQVEFDGRAIPIRDLPAEKKAAIQNALRIRAIHEMGKTRGDYRLMDEGFSNQCIDLPLSLLDQAVQDAGLHFQGNGFREQFTKRLGDWAAANPTAFYGGAAAEMPWRDRPLRPFELELNKINLGKALDLGWAIGRNLPGRLGDAIGYAQVFHGGLGFISNSMDAADYALAHPGDPAADLKIGGAILKGLSLAEIPGGQILGALAFDFAIADTIGSAMRSRILLNRAENLISFGGAVLPGGASIAESLDRHQGSFRIHGGGFSAVGGFELGGSSPGWFQRDPVSRAWSRSEVNNLNTMRGERISGYSEREETRYERGGNLLNLYEPTSVTVVRRSREQFTISKGGGMIMSDDSGKGLGSVPPSAANSETRRPPRPDIRDRRLPALDDRLSIPPPPCWPFCFRGGGAGVPSPSPVGGVSLSGSGGLLEGLGTPKGVRLDANGNIELIGEAGEDIKLPPLRLDDVVTVFRSVYLHGEGPTVTIDPNPENPENSAMIIRHGKATEDTYVGWVLYQADRLMKGYGQGVDNITVKEIASGVPGYADVVDKIYFSAGDPRKSQKEGIWERFWIVPAEARRFEGSQRELTLFDVPLKVKTQKMKWEKDKLVDDLTGQSSPGAMAFTEWFTTHYSAIAAEQYLTPPPESGITTAIPVFEELQRIALTTAVAEKLRDQGVSMPFWMYDYEVRKVPFEKFTPGMEVTRRQVKGDVLQISRLFGGVQLSADNKVIRTYSAVADATKAPPEVRAEVDRSIKLADRLERAVTDRVPPVVTVPLTVHRIEDDNREFRAVSLPGSETQMLGPSRLDEVDVVVPIAGGNDIRLARSFNSFFNPQGPWGKGWALDLPHLVEIRVPVDRQEGKSSYTTGYELLTPLDSFRARFLNGQPVRSFVNPEAPAMDQNSPFLGMTEDRPALFKDATTLLLVLKNGQEWHFTPHGDLVAIKEGPRVTAYERGTEGQVTRIVGLLGGQLAGEINLEYSGDRQLVKAVGTSFNQNQLKPVEVTYAYDNAGRLTGVASDEGTVGYGYQDSRVSAVMWQDRTGGRQPEVLRSFQYNAQGQVLFEKDGKSSIVHTMSSTPEGVVVSSRADSGEAREDSTLTAVLEYDQRLRLIKSIAADGTRSQWSYPAAGGIEMVVTTPDQRSVKVADSPDGRQRTIEQSGAPPIAAQFDSGGRLTSVSEDGRPVLTQEWRPDGQLALAETAAQGASLRYNGQGLLSSIVLHPAKAGEKPSEWQETKLDRQGRPVEITDHSGMRILMGYDESGALTAAVQSAPDGKGNHGYNVKRDEQGRIRTVSSSWGDTSYSYDKEGNLQSIVATRGSRSATVELSAGRVRAMTGFDNGRTSFEYHKDGPFAGMPLSIVCPNGLKLEYEYDDAGNLAAVKVGTDRRVRLEYDAQGRLNVYSWEAVQR
jgi:RHS repeat-associated protein